MTYIIQRYDRCAFYEPAEGGYYYEGCFPDDKYRKFTTKEDAIRGLCNLVVEYNEGVNETAEGFIRLSPDGLQAYSTNHRYIGDGEEFYVEPINRRGRRARGRQIYC